LPEELQKDPITRGQFLWMGAVGMLVGAVVTIPPIVYVLDPAIKSELQGQSDVPDEWQELGSVFEIPADAPKEYRVKFPRSQTYALPKEEGSKEASIMEAVLVSWRDGEIPGALESRGGGNLSEAEIEELTQNLNVVSNHCAHLGCPVRWFPDRGEMLCPCHGGIYDINGDYVGGPPPRGLYRYTFEVRKDGGLYVKHEFDGKPYVV
jgi:Rieske Fe-S protein